MSRSLAVLFVATLAVASPAQSSYETSPKGFMSTEGNTWFYLTSGTAVARRYMGVDDTNKKLMTIKSLAFRQDAGTNPTTGTPDTMTGSVDMGLTNFSLLREVLDDVYKPGSRQVCFPRGPIKFPDWRGAPPSTPAPWTLVFPFTQQFIYLGTDTLVWDMTLLGGTPGDRLTDRYYTGYYGASGADLGAGCVATGRTLGFHIHTQLDNCGSVMGANSMRLDVASAWAPANANTLLSIAVQDANLTVPGWCHKLHAVPLVTLPLGPADALGHHHYQFWSFPYSATLVGQTIVSQAFAADAGKPSGIALSNGTSTVMPAFGGTDAGVAAAYAFSDMVNAPSTGWIYPSGSYIARLEY